MLENFVWLLIGGILEFIGYVVRHIYYLFFAGSYKEADAEYQRKKKKALFGYVLSPNQLVGLVTPLLILLLVLFLKITLFP